MTQMRKVTDNFMRDVMFFSLFSSDRNKDECYRTLNIIIILFSQFFPYENIPRGTFVSKRKLTMEKRPVIEIDTHFQFSLNMKLY